jgi:glycerol-3-phosphate O-acyltransferase
LLYERSAPEFFDRNLFRGFIGTLKEHRFVWLDESGKLDFGDALAAIAKDSRLILSRELRHSILKLTANPKRDTTPAPRAKADAAGPAPDDARKADEPSKPDDGAPPAA